MMDRYLVTSKSGKKFWRRKSARRKLSAFGSAFAEARKKMGKGKSFTFKGKKYSTNMKGENSSKPSKKQMVYNLASDNNLTKK